MSKKGIDLVGFQKTIICFTLLLWFVFHAFTFGIEGTDCIETSKLDRGLFADKVISELQKGKPEADPAVTGYDLQIFTKKDLGTVLNHVQQYCCQESIKSKGTGGTASIDCTGKLDGEHYFAESPYLVDHLVNIGMRKFNGIKEHCDALQIDCTTPSNHTVLMQERRKEVTKLAQDTDGAPPSQFYELFKKYWGDETNFTDTSKKTLLANAYFTMCDEVVKIKQSFSFVSNIKNVENQESAWRKGCQNLITNRYRQEAAYVQSLMVSRGVAYLSNNMQAYFKNHFIDNRMNSLINKLGNMDACFNMVLKYVTRTSCCVN